MFNIKLKLLESKRKNYYKKKKVKKKEKKHQGSFIVCTFQKRVFKLKSK